MAENRGEDNTNVPTSLSQDFGAMLGGSAVAGLFGRIAYNITPEVLDYTAGAPAAMNGIVPLVAIGAPATVGAAGAIVAGSGVCSAAQKLYDACTRFMSPEATPEAVSAPEVNSPDPSA